MPISWEPHGHKKQSVGWVDGVEVAQIVKNKNHTHSNSGIYTVLVRGVALPKRFREIAEARAAGDAAFELDT